MGRGKPPALAILMNERLYKLLKKESRKATTLQKYAERISILLLCTSFGGSKSILEVSRELNASPNTVRKWRNRWTAAYPVLIAFERGPDGKGVSDHDLLQKALSFLDDSGRSGTPKRITLEAEQQIAALACTKPSDYDIEMTVWTHAMLAHVAVAQKIVESVSPRYVGMILKKKSASAS